jgi:hypothetical protein
MLYRKEVAAYSEIHTEHINVLCGQNVKFLSAEPGVHKAVFFKGGTPTTGGARKVAWWYANRLLKIIFFS